MNDRHYPETLKELPIWGLWKIEPGKNGRLTKIPYSPNYDGRASTTNPRTWGVFDRAFQKYQLRPDYYDGIALLISKDYGLVFIDIDHCVDGDGVLNETASDIVGSFGEQFMELSQSGTGVHIIARGSVPDNFNNRKIGVEMYGDKRFCALTGNILCQGEPTEDQSVIDEVYNQYKTPDRSEKPVRSKSGASIHDDQWVIDQASKRGRFKGLFSGDWESEGYGSQSEADLALCLILAFWTERDADQMDRIFRKSGLYRDKWERNDYRETTIQKAVDQCEETFSDYTRQKNMEDFTRFDGDPSEGDTEADDVLKRIQDIDPCNNRLYRNKNDIAFSRLFSEVFKDQVRFNATAKAWYYYDGGVWKKDTESMVVEGYMKTFVKALIVYSLGFDDESFSKAVLKCGDRSKRKKIIEDARDYYYIEQKDFDQDPDLFNCKNCVIDLKTGEPLQHDPALLLSKISNVVYDPDAKSEDFDRFIHEVMMDDEEKIQYLQKIFGYCLTGENTQEQCYMCYGSTTRNGKSTLLEVIGHMMGDYGMNAQPETIAQRERNSRNASEDLARLDGCRFLHMGEPPKRMMFDVALIKSLTGRDPVTTRYNYGHLFEYVPVFKLVINTNYLPVVTDDTLFSSERMKVITFDRHFTPEEQDRRLKGRLKQKENISGIFNWCLEGLRLFNQEGGVLREPEAVKRATEDYRQKSDKIQNFIDDCLDPTPGQNVTLKDVYDAYRAWCRVNGFGTDNKSNFTEDIKGKGLVSSSGTVGGHTVRNVIKDHTVRTPEDTYYWTD